MQKLGLEFFSGEILKSEKMNLIKDKVNELVEEANKIPALESSTKTNSLEILSMRNKEVDISQADFDVLQASGELDPTKTYYIYD